MPASRASRSCDTRNGLPPPDPERVFEQAAALAASPTLRQTDLRISAAYYGLFHSTVTAAADMVVGPGDGSGARYYTAGFTGA